MPSCFEKANKHTVAWHGQRFGDDSQRSIRQYGELLCNFAAIAIRRDDPAMLEQIVGCVRSGLCELAAPEQADADEAPIRAFAIPDADGLLDALLEAKAYEKPVSATEVARVLWHGKHGHSDLIRLGLRFGMLSSVGLVRRHKGDSHRPNRWSLAAE